MKHIEPIAEATNFKAINVGKLSDLNEYELALGPKIKIPGKVFGAQPLVLPVANFPCKRFPPEQKQASCTDTKSTKNCTFSLQEMANFKWTNKFSPLKKAAS